MKSVRTLCALLLLAAWPVLTSHALLEELHLIHVVHEHHDGTEGSHEHNADHHQFADGDYSNSTGSVHVGKPHAGPASLLTIDASDALMARLGHHVPGSAPPGSAPPFLFASWQFLSRAALVVRAPSSLL